MRRSKMAIPLSFLAVLALPWPQAAAQQQAPEPSEEVLFGQVVELPSDRVNAKVRRVTLPADFKTPEHTHAGPGPRYVLRGNVEIVEGGETNTYGPGEVFWESGIPMTAETLGGEEAELVIFELLPPQ
jgi:quercetin dioxygenase-like cupin family protein